MWRNSSNFGLDCKTLNSLHGDSAEIARALEQLPSLSRRGFFSLAAALGITVAGSGLDGLFVRAYADEQANTTAYKLYVVKHWELPVVFLDMADADNPQSVVGATVQVASLHNGKVATANTDDYGVAILDITDLVEDDPYIEHTYVRTEYEFYGSLTVAASGYQTYETGKLRIHGGEQIDAPTRPLDGNPYVQCVTINGWDILHAKETTFVATPSNPTTPHRAVVKVAGGSGAATVSLFQEGGVCHQASVVFDDEGVATATMEGQFFSTKSEDANQAFVPAKPIALAVECADGEYIAVTTSASGKEGSLDGPLTEGDIAGGANLSATSFLLDSNAITLFRIPDSFPAIGGASFSFESILPQFPLSLEVKPSGYLVAGVGYVGSLHREGNPDGVWQHDTFQNAKDEYARKKQEWNNEYTKFKQARASAHANGSKAPKMGKLAPISSFEMNFQCGGMLHMECGDYLADSSSADKYVGAAQLYAIVSGEYSYTQQIVVYMVPLFVRFQLGAALRATIDVGVAVTKSTYEPPNKLHLSDGASFSFNLKPELAVTLGVGVADVASVGVRGAGYLSAFYGVYFEAPDGKPNPRLSLEGGAEVSVVIQVALFKGSFNAYSFDGVIADNWAESQVRLLDSGNDDAHALDGSDLNQVHQAYRVVDASNGHKGFSMPCPFDADGGVRSGADALRAFVNGAVPVNQAQLLASAEFIAVPKPALQDSEGELASASSDSYDYVPVQKRERLGEANAQSRLQSVGEAGAVVLGGTVHEDAFSDPRMKIVSVNGVPWMLRILAVNYGSNDQPVMRTRLSVARWSFDAAAGETVRDGHWASVEVIAFTPDYGTAVTDNASMDVPTREQLYDYDFAVLSARDAGFEEGACWEDGGMIRVFLTSGTRESNTLAVVEGDDESGNQGEFTVGAALSHTVGTFLSIGLDANREMIHVKTAKSFLDTYGSNPLSTAGLANLLGNGALDFSYATFTYPFVLHAMDASKGSVTALFAFCRVAETADALISGPYYEFPATAFFDSRGNSLTGKLTFAYDDGPQNNIEDYRAVLSDVKTSVSVGVLESNVSGGNQFRIGCQYITPSGDGSCKLKSFALLRAADAVPGGGNAGQVLPYGAYDGFNDAEPQFVYPWPVAGIGGALCATSNGLYVSTFVLGSAEFSAPTGISVTPMALDEGVNLNNFALDSQSGMLYYTTAREGKQSGELRLDGTRGDVAEVKDYRIWATRCIGVTKEGVTRTGFMKPYSLIQSEDPIDQLVYLDLEDAYGFMTNSITSMMDSTSRIMLYKLPYLKRVALMDFSSLNRYVCAGEQEVFRVTVRNDGNVSVSAFSLAITIAETNYVIDFDLTKTTDIIPIPGVDDVVNDGSVASVDASDNAATPQSRVTGAQLDFATEAGVLNPGVSRTYQFMWKVPEDLHGETNLIVTVVEDELAGNGAQSENGVFTGEGSRFRSAAFASAVNSDIAPSSFSTSMLFQVPNTAELPGDDDDPEDSNPPVPGDKNETQPSVPGGQGEASNASANGASNQGQNGQQGNTAPTGDTLSNVATTAAATVAAVGLAGVGLAAKHLHEEVNSEEL